MKSIIPSGGRQRSAGPSLATALPVVESRFGPWYRALVGEARNNPEVRDLVAAADLVISSAAVLDRTCPSPFSMPGSG
jgi:hypothetical protein